MGAFKVAQKKGVPIVPVVFHDNWRRFFWSKHKKRVSLGTLRFQVMPALTAAGESEEDLLLLRDKVFEGIQNKLHQEK